MGGRKKAKKAAVVEEDQEELESNNLLDVPNGEKGKVFGYLKGATVKKAALQRIIDELILEERITCKEYGKAKIYSMNQALLPDSDPQEMQEIEQQIKVVEESVKEAQESYRSIHTKLQKLQNVQPPEELQKLIDEYKSNNQDLEIKIGRFDNKEPVSDEQRQNAENKKQQMQKYAQQSKRLYINALGILADALDLKPTELEKLAEIERPE